jgi:hypothetical protein
MESVTGILLTTVAALPGFWLRMITEVERLITVVFERLAAAIALEAIQARSD